MANILETANELTAGDRQESYGHPADTDKPIAEMWSIILGTEVKPDQVPLCMIALKMCREMHKPKADNLVDIAGYARTLEMHRERSENARRTHPAGY